MEIKVNAVVLKSIDYNENDKLLTLYTLEEGKLTAVIKGVKKAAARLKFCGQPFCFAEIMLYKKAGKYTVTNAFCFDMFNEIYAAPDKYFAGAAVLEIANAFASEEQNAKLFNLLINALKNLKFENFNAKLVLCDFLFNILSVLGFSVNSFLCANCGKEIKDRVLFDFENAEFCCFECAGIAAERNAVREIKNSTYKIIKDLISGKPLGEITADDKSLTYALKMLSYYSELKTEQKIKSILLCVDLPH